MKKSVALVSSAFALAAFMATPASAQEVISIPVEGIIYGEEGSVHALEPVAVPEQFVGSACDGAAATDNNGSVHPDTDLIISTGGTTVTIENVETKPGEGHEIKGQISLGETVDVSVRLGADGVTSGGFVISFTCAPLVPPTVAPTTTAAPVPTTAPEPSGPTTVPESTTTVAAEVAATTAPPPAGPSATLPVTGTSTTYLVASGGFALLGAGVALLALLQLTASRVRVNRISNR